MDPELTDDQLDDALEDLLLAEGLRRRRAEDQFKQALRSSRRIGMAVGFLMARYDLDERQAFAALVRTSRNNNWKLRDVAATVLESGRLPEEP